MSILSFEVIKIKGDKMKACIKTSIIFLLLLILSCSEESTNPTGIYKVSGVTYQNNVIVENASLQLKKDNEVVQETISDDTGYFEFSNVAADKYSLVTKQTSDNGSFLNSQTNLTVNGDVFLSSLVLPKPVTMLPPLSIGAKQIELCWTPYTGDGFYEYKVYRHNSTALDETTGTLCHIATNRNDTTFVDDGTGFSDSGLMPDMTFYYRVYVNNEFGKMGGSNILKTKTNKWDNEGGFTAFYNLQLYKSFSTPRGTIYGLDTDGEYLWILSVESIGGYYNNNNVKLIKYNIGANAAETTFEYNDENIIPRSLMFADNYLWVFYDDVMGARMNKISPETGEVVSSFSANRLADMTSFNGYVYETMYAVDGDFVRKKRLSDFSLVETFPIPIFAGLIDGIAVRENEMWITSRFINQIAIFNEQGKQTGVVTSIDGTGGPGFRLCFIGDKIAYNYGGTVYINDIITVSP